MNKDSTFQDYLRTTAAEPVFVILGVQGSGTNLLSRLMTRLFGFSVLHDRSMVFNQAAVLGNVPTPGQVARSLATVRARLFPSSLARKTRKDVIRNNAAFEGIEEHLDASAIHEGSHLARLVYSYRAYSLGTNRMAIKSDDISERIDAIDEVLPNRRLVLLTRDFRDNLLSIAGKNFGPIDPIRAAVYVKERFAPYAHEFQRSQQNKLHVRFEDLVSDPTQFARVFSERFGVELVATPDAALSNFPIKAGKVRKWERMLDPAVLSRCEAILRDELATWGYSLSTTPREPSGSEMIRAKIRDIVSRVPQKVRATALFLRR